MSNFFVAIQDDQRTEYQGDALYVLRQALNALLEGNAVMIGEGIPCLSMGDGCKDCIVQELCYGSVGGSEVRLPTCLRFPFGGSIRFDEGGVMPLDSSGLQRAREVLDGLEEKPSAVIVCGVINLPPDGEEEGGWVEKIENMHS